METEPAEQEHELRARLELGRELAELRQKRGLTLRELGTRAGVSPTAISEIEAGKRDAYASTLMRLTAQLGVRVKLTRVKAPA